MTVSGAGGLYPSELRPYRVVVLSPAFDEHLVRRAIDSLDRLLTRLTLQCVEDFSFRSSSRSFPLKDSPESVLPGAAWFDEQRLHADPAEPGSDDFGRELRAVIGTDVIGRSSIREQVGQEMENVVGAEPPGHQDGQTLPIEFIDDGKHPECPAIMCPGLNEVIGPAEGPANSGADERRTRR